ncbi:MAG: hypothetical protein WKF78_02790 [Candidatus Limnocylindrales bacterium]
MLLKGQDADEHRARQHALQRRTLRRRTLRLPAGESALRRRVEEGRATRSRTSTSKRGFDGPLRGRAAAHQRRLVPVPAAHDLRRCSRLEEGGGRLAIVFNGSPLFTGGAGSGECEIRRWIIENDWLEAIVAAARAALLQHRHHAPTSGCVTNRKSARAPGQGPARRRPSELYPKMRKQPGQQAPRDQPRARSREITGRCYACARARPSTSKILPDTSASATGGSRWSGRCGCDFEASEETHRAPAGRPRRHRAGRSSEGEARRTPCGRRGRGAAASARQAAVLDVVAAMPSTRLRVRPAFVAALDERARAARRPARRRRCGRRSWAALRGGTRTARSAG